jgi:pimeloyl-ACP methyl ester carboxylesterase
MSDYLRDISKEISAIAKNIYFHIKGYTKKSLKKLQIYDEQDEGISDDDRILIACHGYGQRGFAFDGFDYIIKQDRLPIKLERFEYNFRQDIRISAEQLNKKIKSYGRHVDVLGHSEGGLVVRYAVQAIDSQNVDNVITIATPHTGTIMALPIFGKSARQMWSLNGWKPSHFLKHLNSLPIPKNIHFINAYPVIDECIWPHNGYWDAEGVENIELSPGHVRVIIDNNDIRKILSCLRKQNIFKQVA